MKKFILIIVLLLNFNLLLADEFKIQRDSYFVPLRSKIYWTLGNGASFGSGYGYGGGTMGMGYIELLRILGKVKPAPSLIEYIWASLVVGYGNYESSDTIEEFAPGYFAIGLGLKINNNDYPLKFVPYGGFGLGSAGLFTKYDIHSSNPSSTARGGDLLYVEIAGLEWYISKELSIFIEQSYSWGTFYDDKNFFPNWDDFSNVPLSDGSFKRYEIPVRQFKISIGTRFYWGQDMFWWFWFW